MHISSYIMNSEETPVGERVAEHEDMEDFYEMRCVKRTWSQTLKKLNWDSHKRTMKNTHGEIRKKEDKMCAQSLRSLN